MRPMARTQRFARRVLAAPAHSVTQTCVRKKQVRKSKVRKMCAKCAKGDGGKSVREVSQCEVFRHTVAPSVGERARFTRGVGKVTPP